MDKLGRKVRKAVLGGLLGLVGLGGVALADDLEIRNVATGTGAGGINLRHSSGAQEGFDSSDATWASQPASPTQPEMKIVTKPYGVELRYDYRPLGSMSKFIGYLSVTNRNVANAIITTTTNRIRFNFNGAADSQTNYLTKITRDAQYNASGQEINVYTNLASFVPMNGSTFAYLDGLPGIKNVPEGVYYGSFESSKTPTNSTLTTLEDTPLLLDTTNHISGAAYTFLSNPTKGNITGTGQNLTYNPNANENGNDFFSYQIKDPAGNVLAVEQRNITITPVNDAPYAYATNINVGNLSSVNGQAIGGDIDSSVTYGYVAGSGPTNGTLNSFNSSGGFSYTPNRIVGADGFKFYVFDGQLYATNDVNLNITDQNSAPTITSSGITNLYKLGFSGTIGTADGNGDERFVEIANTNGIQGLFTLSGANGTNYSFVPINNPLGSTNTAQLRVRDNFGGTNYGSLTFVNEANRRPTVNSVGQPYNVGKHKTLEGLVTGDDFENGANGISFAVDAAPLHGDFTLDSNGVFRYTSTNTFAGLDSFSVRSNDGDTNSLPVNFAINVTNNPPIILQTPIKTLDFDPGIYSWKVSGNELRSTNIVWDPNGEGVGVASASSTSPGIEAGYYPTYGSGIVAVMRDKGVTNGYANIVYTNQAGLSATGRVDIIASQKAFRVLSPQIKDGKIFLEGFGVKDYFYDFKHKTNLNNSWTIDKTLKCTNGYMSYAKNIEYPMEFFSLWSSWQNEMTNGIQGLAQPKSLLSVQSLNSTSSSGKTDYYPFRETSTLNSYNPSLSMDEFEILKSKYHGSNSVPQYNFAK